MNFQQDVIHQSFSKPVLVDFWAPWCGPCRVLGPVLDELAAEQSDRWELVKVNTEEEPDLAQLYRIRGIPNVKLFYQGEPIAEFAGALPRFQVERWLAQHLPDARKEALADLLEALEGAPADLRTARLKHFVDQYPDLSAARLALAAELVLTEPERALEHLDNIDLSAEEFNQKEDLRTLTELAAVPDSPESAVEKALADVRTALQQNNREQAIKRTIDAVIADKDYARELPRRLAIVLFHRWGDEDPLTHKYRRMFDMALY